MPLKTDRLRAITLDLDDTLWPVMPVIVRAEASLQAWFAVNAPRVVERFDLEGLRAVRESVARDCPHWEHDFSAQRRESIRRVLASVGEDEALATPAFEVFFAERQRVELFDDVRAALQRLSVRWPLVALTNGNADVGRVGLGAWFSGCISAREVGVGKPDVRIFSAACERLGCSPHEVLHVGDDAVLDVAGARAAGLQAAWIRRRPVGAPLDHVGYETRHTDETAASADWHGPDLLALAKALGV